ncbi:hypothetical protein BAE44_0005329 [Dichanthelium oligosanthes]|uniref:Uncharacterized protein n=1 Tax=Dichanthelium oligosanthes TaxID=888268 RepID=A0A1E5W8A4_9POAL|nr:hypothetical protein BAE44_0005329 [Dichanthelium oligosanthes]
MDGAAPPGSILPFVVPASSSGGRDPFTPLAATGASDAAGLGRGAAGQGCDSIDPGAPGRVVSPAFDITLRMNKTCADRADVVVAYAGVALGWARVEPRDCEEKRWAKDVEVVARGEGVGLPERLRDRMASEWRRSGTLEVVSYTHLDVYKRQALGWARVEPRDCEEKRWAKDVEVVARGEGVACQSASGTAWRRSGGGRARWSSTSTWGSLTRAAMFRPEL